MFCKIMVGVCLWLSLALAQQDNKVELGRLQNGAAVSFVRNAGVEWRIEVSGGASPQLTLHIPVQIEIFRNENDILKLESGYQSIRQSGNYIYANAEIKYNDIVIFGVEDRWNLYGDTVSVNRKVDVTGTAPGGFNSSMVFSIDSSVQWPDVNCMAPGTLYGDPSNNGDRSNGGTLNYSAKRFLLREDMLTAPLLALSFKNGSSITMLDPSPNGQSTVEETKLLKDVMTDGRFQFGTFGVWQTNNNPIEFGFQFPGTASIYTGGSDTSVQPRWIRRFHPIAGGVKHNYEVNFLFGINGSFRDLSRKAWRWAWNTLKPAVTPIDVELVRRVLIDHLAAQAKTIEGRTGIPFALATYDTNHLQWNWTMIALGFVSKNIECADQLLREGDRDNTERGQKMRKTGLDIITSMIEALPTVPLKATGYDLATGKPWDDHIWLAPWIRNATEDMRVLMRAYQRERTLGRRHPEWFRWVKSYTDWLIMQQRDDGSFPRLWKTGSNEVAETTGTTSYCPVPLLVMMTEETNDPGYMQAAIRAAEYIWINWGTRGLYIGGASDNPNITDKEAGMLSMEAFMSLYEATKEPKWLERARAAADYTETWIWIWNLPMPVDADDLKLHWKKNVSIVGVQGISARSGGADEYLDWSVASYVKLYKFTNDKHYLDVARILLHNTKSMVALPGRLYDMKGPGWQQEGWRMIPGGNGRGVGGHRFWLPWISANHLYSINGLEEYDLNLYKQLSAGN